MQEKRNTSDWFHWSSSGKSNNKIKEVAEPKCSNHIWEKPSTYAQICQVKLSSVGFELILQFATLWNPQLNHKHLRLSLHSTALTIAIYNQSAGKFPNLQIPALFFPFLSLFIWLILCTSTYKHTTVSVFCSSSVAVLFVFHPWTVNTHAHAHTC